MKHLIRRAKNSAQNQIIAAAELVDWGTLRSLGQSTILKTSYFWLLFVPIAAQLLNQLEDPLNITLFGHSHRIELTLPFSWYVFYLSAICFATSTLLYSFFCPRIPKSFANSSDFHQAGNGAYYLATEVINIPENMRKERVGWQFLTIAHRSTDQRITPRKASLLPYSIPSQNSANAFSSSPVATPATM